MKLGEIRVSQGGFEMMTPGGIRPITLRCTANGEVHVEEVSGGGLVMQPLKITQVAHIEDVDPAVIAQRAAQERRNA